MKKAHTQKCRQIPFGDLKMFEEHPIERQQLWTLSLEGVLQNLEGL